MSLRDDEGITRRTLERVLDDQWELEQLKLDHMGKSRKKKSKKRTSSDSEPKGRGILSNLEDSGRLEISYFPPGYITPEEFFHRVLLSVSRLKAGDQHSHVSLLFNSIDQLSSRFPLCAKEDIFVPGLIQMLSAEGVTSFFVAAHEPHQKDQTSEYHGLLSMAELILEFERDEFDRDHYLACVEKTQSPKETNLALASQKLSPLREAVRLRVARFAGGEPAGSSGILELIDSASPLFDLFGKKEGLHFVPFAEDSTGK